MSDDDDFQFDDIEYFPFQSTKTIPPEPFGI